VAVALGFWQQITGTEAVLYYSADFLSHAGLESASQRLLGNCFVGLCKLIPEMLAMQVVDSIGRRPLIRCSCIALTLSTATLAFAFWKNWSPLLVVVLLCSIMASFSIGLGPFSFLVASENLGLSERATGVTLCASVNRMTSGTVALTAVSVYEGIGPAGLFALYAALGCASIPFYFTSVHETSGQTLEELAARQRGIPDHRNRHLAENVDDHHGHVPLPDSEETEGRSII
jgi:MFS family permease